VPVENPECTSPQKMVVNGHFERSRVPVPSEKSMGTEMLFKIKLVTLFTTLNKFRGIFAVSIEIIVSMLISVLFERKGEARIE
jgi:hypothetical protein